MTPKAASFGGHREPPPPSERAPKPRPERVTAPPPGPPPAALTGDVTASAGWNAIARYGNVRARVTELEQQAVIDEARIRILEANQMTTKETTVDEDGQPDFAELLDRLRVWYDQCPAFQDAMHPEVRRAVGSLLCAEPPRALTDAERECCRAIADTPRCDLEAIEADYRCFSGELLNLWNERRPARTLHDVLGELETGWSPEPHSAAATPFFSLMAEARRILDARDRG